jgi:hypothetical protein
LIDVFVGFLMIIEERLLSSRKDLSITSRPFTLCAIVHHPLKKKY